jgi:hypothetical protein
MQRGTLLFFNSVMQLGGQVRFQLVLSCAAVFMIVCCLWTLGSGESYAGVYVPLLASKLLRLRQDTLNGGDVGPDVSPPTINLKGIVVGNGVTDDVVRLHVQTVLLCLNHSQCKCVQQTTDSKWV